MRTREFKTFSAEDQEVARLQDNVAEFTRPLVASPLTDALLLGPVTVGTTPTEIAHKLGRSMKSWILAAPLANAQVWEVARNSKTITLQASSNVVCSLVVF